MPNETKMLEILVDKLSKDRQYMAWYLYKYMDIENKSFLELLKQLDVSQDKFFDIAMCKAPDSIEENFSYRIKQIADFTGVNLFPLVQIIRSIDNSISFNNSDAIHNSLMAAREKKLPDNNNMDSFNEES